MQHKLHLLLVLLMFGLNLQAKETKQDPANQHSKEDKVISDIKPDPRIKDFNNTITLYTVAGLIELKLYPKIAPLAVENFATHVNEGYYDGVIFHRVIKGFMIQSGDPKGTGKGGRSIWKKPFQNEISPKVKFDKPFLLAMANHGPMSNGSQFFITTKKTPWLDGKYTIFGEVVKGEKVVKKLESIAVDSGDRPMFKIYIKRAFINK